MIINPPKSVLQLVGGFNPVEKYESKWESFPNRDENKKCWKPPSRQYMMNTPPKVLYTEASTCPREWGPAKVCSMPAKGNWWSHPAAIFL